ncbi:unnamed protein product, partial [Chrysoparadoxa australica]
ALLCHTSSTQALGVNFCSGGCWDTSGVSYISDFLAACVECRVDAIAVHSFTCNVEFLNEQLFAYQQFGLPIWLTEFSCADDPGLADAAGQLTYMQETLPYLEANPNIQRYSWFTGRVRPDYTPEVALLAGTGVLTPLGNFYSSFEFDNMCKNSG